MNQALIDLSLLIGSIAAALFFTRRTARRLFSFFLLFPQFLFFGNMLAHTVAVLVVNLIRVQEGTFRFSFQFYSLLLFGIVFMLLSGKNIRMAQKRIGGDLSQGMGILKGNGLTILFFFPVIFLNPIGSLPILTSVLSSLTLWIGGWTGAQRVPGRAKGETGVPEVAL